MKKPKPVYRRVLLKLSGQFLGGEAGRGIDFATCVAIAQACKQLHEHKVQVGLVIGGGNILRGARQTHERIPRVPADHIGMMATLCNGLVLQQAFLQQGVPARIFTAFVATELIERFSWSKANAALDEGSVALFVGGTGHPYFTTDSAAALRAAEMQADILLKATDVDGVYDKDPALFPDAKRYDKVSFEEVLEKRLGVMDLAAISLCWENGIPIKVFAMESLWRAVTEPDFGTVVTT